MKKLVTILSLLTLSFAAVLNIPSDYPTIQLGINTAISGDTVFVSPGIYYENINFNGKNIVIIGYDRETTIIDGGANNSVVIFDNGENENSVLSNFTIRNGQSDNGGGIFCRNSSPSIINNFIYDNSAYNGGGIYFMNSNAYVFNNIIMYNESNMYGGAIYIENGNINIIKSTINNNHSYDEGAIYSINSNNVINSSIVWENYKSISNNSFPFASYLSGIYGSQDFVISYSILQDNIDGIGNLYENPRMIRYYSPINTNYDYHPTSPCINNGDPNIDLDSDGSITDIGSGYYNQSLNPIYGCLDETAINYNPLAEFNSGTCYHGFVEDIDNNIYKTIRIGDQIWMKENLITTKYSNGDDIASHNPYDQTDSYWWYHADEGVYAFFPNIDSYSYTGYLYNWMAVDDERNICPEGWHVPTDEEYMRLEQFLGIPPEDLFSIGIDRGHDEGTFLKDLYYWNGTDTFGLSVKQGGFLDSYNSSIFDIGLKSYIWTSTQNDLDSYGYAFGRSIGVGYMDDDSDISNINRQIYEKKDGLSVRCIQNILGCTNPNASNYNEFAFEDDGSCCIDLWGECYNINETSQLFLYNNNYEGSIPENIGELINLTWMSLSNNQISGPIPSSIGNLINLKYLDLFNNQLSGPIPSSFGNLVNIRLLTFNNNDLSGSIPNSFGNLEKLRYLRLEFNQLSGNIPSSLFLLDSLGYLNLSNNLLEGEIPDISHNIYLSEILLNNNYLTGELNPNFFNPNIYEINIANNQISGSISDDIKNLTNLYRFEIDNNEIVHLTDEICNLENLKWFSDSLSSYMFNNKICPPYPECLTEIQIGFQNISECIGYIVGDVNYDSEINIQDIIIMIDYIVEEYPITDYAVFDVIPDGDVNILDVVNLIYIIIEG